MKDTCKYKFFYTELNSRLGFVGKEVKHRSKTLELPRAWYDGYNVDAMESAFYGAIQKYVQKDSTVRVQRIKVGTRTFML